MIRRYLSNIVMLYHQAGAVLRVVRAKGPSLASLRCASRSREETTESFATRGVAKGNTALPERARPAPPLACAAVRA